MICVHKVLPKTRHIMKNRNGEDTNISPEDSFEDQENRVKEEVENVDSAMEELNGLRVELADCCNN